MVKNESKKIYREVKYFMSFDEEKTEIRFLVSINPLTEITYDRCDFSWRERESCDTSSTSESTNGRLWRALSAESIDRWTSVKGTRHEARKDRVRRPAFEIDRCALLRVVQTSMRKDSTHVRRFLPCKYLHRERESDTDPNYKKKFGETRSREENIWKIIKKVK